MRILATGLLFCLCSSAPLLAGETPLTAYFDGQVGLAFRTIAQPGGQPLASSGSVLTSGRHSAHRVIIDPSRRVYLIYKISWEPTSEASHFSLSVLPPDPDVVQRYASELASGSRRLELPQYPPTQQIGFGDVVTLDVLRDPRRRVTVVDTMSVVDPHHEPNLSPPEKPARDFTLADVELKVIHFTIKTDDIEVQGGGGCSGAILWFYLPEYGRFLFSIADQPGYGFEKIGVIRDNRITFNYAGTNFEWSSSQPVMARGAWNLWVRADPDYTPDLEPLPGTAVIGAADRVGYLLGTTR